MLQGDAGDPIELDVSRVRDQLPPLVGRLVTVSGRLKTVQYPERGATPVLEVESIQAV